MKALKNLIIGLIVGLLLGLWFGVNIGKGNPVFGNPFAEEDLQKKIKQKLGNGVEKMGDSLGKLGEDMKKK